MAVTPAELEHALRHEAALRQLAAVLRLDASDTDDAVQHAMTQVALGRRPSGTPLLAFLRATLRNHAFNLRKLALRRRRREGTVARADTAAAADELVARDQLRRRVADAALALDEPYRTTIWLRWFEGLDVEAVAARMQVPANTVRTRLRRAHAQLRERLDRDYGDRQWLLLAAPIAVEATANAAIETVVGGLLVKKFLAGVAAVLFLLALTLEAWPEQPVVPPSPVAGDAAVATGVVDAPQDPGEALAREPQPVQLRAARPELRIERADRTPATGVRVWFWNAQTRPSWTERARVRTSWPAGLDDVYQQAEPDPTDLRADARGAITLPDPAPVAATVELAPKLWFSVELPLGRTLVLPAICPVSARVRGAPAGSRWAVTFYGAWRERDGDFHWGAHRRDVRTPSGDGVVRIDPFRVEGSSREALVATALEGLPWQVAPVGQGFLIADVDEPRPVPCEFRLQVEKRLPRIVFAVREANGAPTGRAGIVCLRMPDGGISLRRLEGGQAVFDEQDFGGSSRCRLRMDDGEHVECTVDLTEGDWLHRVELTLGQGTKPLRVDLPGLARSNVNGVFLETAATGWQRVCVFDDFGHDEVVEYGVHGRGLWVAGLAPGFVWQQLCVVTDAGRVALVEAQPGDELQGAWMPAAAPASVDVGGYYRRFGNRPAMRADLELGLPKHDGGTAWMSLLWHSRSPEEDGQTPPPVWSGLTMPLAVPWRLRICEGTRSGVQVLGEFTQLR